MESSMGLGRTNFHHLPNVAQGLASIEDRESKALPKVGETIKILFFGVLDSAVNVNAFLYLNSVEGLDQWLEKQNAIIEVVGKSPTSVYKKAQKRIKVIGPVENISSVIKNADIILLPLKFASGTCTRVLEVAHFGKCLICTNVAMKGLEFSADSFFKISTKKSLIYQLEEIFSSKERWKDKEKLIYKEYSSKHRTDIVDKKFDNILESVYKKKKLALITNRFYPDIGGAEINIYHQAKMLACEYDLTVYTPIRQKTHLKTEDVDGFRIKRCRDWLHFFSSPNQAAKTLTPFLLFFLLRQQPFAIIAFPSLNLNNKIAWLYSKLTGALYIQCFFDYLDYSTLLKNNKSIELEKYPPSWMEQKILKTADQLFAISEKELLFLKKYNENTFWSPVPVTADEYKKTLSSPRKKYNIPEDAFVYLSLGRVSFVKGQDIFLEAFCKQSKKLKNAWAVLLGRNDYSEIDDKIKDILSKSNCAERVIFTGAVERHEVLQWLASADVHVIPVRFMNSGAVVVESYFSGTPVIQSDRVDPNLIVEKENGYLFKGESVTDLEDKLLMAYTQKDKLPELAKLGKEKLIPFYYYEYLIDLYLKALDGKKLKYKAIREILKDR